MSAKKTLLLQDSVKYLGRLIDEQGIRPKKEDIKSLAAWPQPTTEKEMRSFLGFVNFLTEFIDSEKDITAPLRAMSYSKFKHLVWTDESRAAFIAIKKAVQGNLRLAFPIFGREDCPFVLNTDASKSAVSAVLRQRQPNGSLRVVSFASRTMNPAERAYSMPHKEVLASVFGLRRFDKTIRGNPLEVEVDHIAVVKSWLKAHAEDEKIKRWLIVLQGYMPCLVRHVRGTDNIADPMSRNPAINADWDKLDDEEKRIFDERYVNGVSMEYPRFWWHPEVRRKVEENMEKTRIPRSRERSSLQCNIVQGEEWFNIPKQGLLEERPDQQESVRNEVPFPSGGGELHKMSKAQREDEWCGPLIHYLEDPMKEGVPKELRARALDFFMQGGSLFKAAPFKPRLVVPASMKTFVLKYAHDSKFSGHGGVTSTFNRLRLDFWWSNMWSDIQKYVRECESCQKFKQGAPQRASSGKVGGECPHPFHTVNLDIKGPLPRSRSGKTYIISWIDTATRYAMAFAVPNKDSDTIINTLNYLIVDHGFPRRIISNRDNAFLGKKFTDFTKSFGIELAANPAYSKWMSGTVERFHGSIASVICHYVGEKRDNWDDFLLYALFAYRTAYQTRLGASPFSLLYGRDPNTVAASCMGADLIRDPDTRGVAQRLEQAFQSAARLDGSRKERKMDVLSPGRWIMVKKTEGRSGLEPRWVAPFEVVSSSGVEVKYLNKKGLELVAHRSHTKLYHETPLEELPILDLDEEGSPTSE